jgi:hypothetical protein
MSKTITIQITISDHAYDRGKERLGLDKSAFEKIATKAYIAGKPHKDCKGRLKTYVTSLYFQYQTANNIRIYGENIYLFKNNTLITCYQLPNEFNEQGLKPLGWLCSSADLLDAVGICT